MFGIKRENHQRMRDNLSAYVDGELNVANRADLERHLEGCAECRAELTSLRSLVSLLHQVPQIEPRRSFALASAPVPARQGAIYPWALRTAAMATGVVLIAVFSADLVGVLPGDQSGIGVAPAPTTSQATVMLQETPEATGLPELESAQRDSGKPEPEAEPPIVEGDGAPPSMAAAVEGSTALSLPEAGKGDPLALPTEASTGQEPAEPLLSPTQLVPKVPLDETLEDASNGYLPAIEGSLAALLAGTGGAYLFLTIRRRRSKGLG
jgi:hypothetical protein